MGVVRVHQEGWVLEMFLIAYLCGWLLTTFAAWVAADAFGEKPMPRPRTRLMLAVVAGALWPVLVVGAAQFAGVVYLAKRLTLQPARCKGRRLSRHPGRDIENMYESQRAARNADRVEGKT